MVCRAVSHVGLVLGGKWVLAILQLGKAVHELRGRMLVFFHLRHCFPLELSLRYEYNVLQALSILECPRGYGILLKYD